MQCMLCDDDEVLALCSVWCVLQSVGDDDDGVSGFYPVGGGGASPQMFQLSLPKYVACCAGPYPILDTGGFFFFAKMSAIFN